MSKVHGVLSFEGCIISFSNKNSNIPLTRADHIKKYRQKNSSVRHEYYSLATAHSSLSQFMFTFTVGGRGRGVYTKLRLTNEIKSYVTYLISNSKADIYFFSNIEIGHSLSNPHLHTQVWSDDKDTVRVIYDKVIAKFSLKSKRCKLSKPQQPQQFYNYVIKDYSKDLSDNDLWNLEQTKIRMRRHTYIDKDGLKQKLNIRFYSKSKGKYTQKMYRMAYRVFGVLRVYADDFLDLVTSNLFFKREFLEELLHLKTLAISSFISIKNKGLFNFEIHFFCFSRNGIDILFYSPATSPPWFVLV